MDTTVRVKRRNQNLTSTPQDIDQFVTRLDLSNNEMKGQSEIAYLPKFANMMLIVMVIVITEILSIILIFDCFENQ